MPWMDPMRRVSGCCHGALPRAPRYLIAGLWILNDGEIGG